MSKKKETTKGIENVEQTLTKTEQFLEQNYKPLLYVLAGAVVLVGIVWLLRMYTSKKNDEALSQMFMAEQYFGQDSLSRLSTVTETILALSISQRNTKPPGQASLPTFMQEHVLCISVSMKMPSAT